MSKSLSYALFGFLFGLCFPVVATLLRASQLEESWMVIQQEEMLLWVIDTAPLFLAIFAGFAGFRHDQVTKLASGLEEQVAERTQAAEDANQAKDTFLAKMSHEIRTPISSIMGFAEEIYENPEATKGITEHADTIIHNSNHLLIILNDILDYSKIEADKMEFSFTEISPFQLTKDIKSLISMDAKKKGVSFNIEYKYPLPRKIISDQVRLKQVLLNLCSNAVKFTNEGEVKVQVACEEDDTSQIVFRVIDTGVGLTKEQQSKIFNPFAQADKSIAGTYGGTGLGLHISQEIVTSMQGTIGVKSQERKGAEFTVTLPVGNPVDDKMLYSYPVELKEKPKARKGKKPKVELGGKVMLAEDSLDIQQLIKMRLAHTGVKLTMVSNGEEAWERYLHEDFDLLLVDVNMPVMSGIDFIEKVRSTEDKIPVVVISGNGSEEDAKEYSSKGADNIITKPIDWDHLYRVLGKHLLGKEKYSELLSYVKEESDQRTPHTEEKVIHLNDRFMERLPYELGKIVRYYMDKEWGPMEDEIHKLKGLAEEFEFQVLVKKTNEVYLSLHKDKFDELDRQMDELIQICRYLDQQHEKAVA